MIEITTIILSLMSICSIGDVLFKSSLKKYIQYLFFIWCIILIFIAGLRVDTADYKAYVNLFNWTPNIIDTIINNEWNFFIFTREEIGYLLLNSLVKLFTDESSFLFLIVATISISLYYKCIKMYALFPLVSLLIYFSFIYCVKELAQIRQGMAIAIFLYSLRYLIYSNFKKYILCIGLAGCFHLSIWAMLFIYPIRKIKVNTINIFIFFIVSLLIGLFDIANNIIINLFSNLEIMQRVLSYLNSEFLDNSNLYRLYKYLMIFLFLGMFNKILRKKYIYYDLMMVILGYGLFIMSIWSKYPFFGERFAAPCWISLIFLLPTIIELSNNKIYKMIMILLIIGLAINSYISNLGLISV